MILIKKIVIMVLILFAMPVDLFAERQAQQHAVIKQNFNLNHQDVKGYTLLHDAVYHHNITKVHKFIAQGADVNLKNKVGLAPLHTAVLRADSRFAREYDKIVRLLITAQGADINIQDNQGRTPLHFAVISNN